MAYAKYVDVYKRPVNDGDVVLCLSVSSYTESSNSVLNCTLTTVGKEWGHNEPCRVDGKVYCYKIEDPIVKQIAATFRTVDWFDRYRDAGREFSGEYDGVVYNELLEMTGRPVKPGDFVIYDFQKTKANYGIIIDKNHVIVDTGAIKKLNYGLLLVNLTAKEQECKDKIAALYNEYMQNKASGKKLVGTNYVPGQVYLTTDGKNMVIYVGECGYTVEYKGVVTTTSPNNFNDLFLKAPVSSKVSQKIRATTINGRSNVKFSEVIKGISLTDIYDYCIYPYWDRQLARQLVPYGVFIPQSYKGERWQEFERKWGVGIPDSFYSDLISELLVYQVFKGNRGSTSKFKWHSKDKVKFRKGTTIFSSIILDKDIVIMDSKYVKVTMHIKNGV